MFELGRAGASQSLGEEEEQQVLLDLVPSGFWFLLNP
jgi:hypothetical protein